ncbi:hypothetical protein JOB18_040111 [Solea senegalensis]|uniref:Uncharacterized protein n=1 Tax=Solea senegalensis TaxID=28829 RepID=A0AAV6SMX4_SOLSE|nr:hypothetical protein JOB18_040111 [Solea senegalensis]
MNKSNSEENPIEIKNLFFKGVLTKTNTRPSSRSGSPVSSVTSSVTSRSPFTSMTVTPQRPVTSLKSGSVVANPSSRPPLARGIGHRAWLDDLPEMWQLSGTLRSLKGEVFTSVQMHRLSLLEFVKCEAKSPEEAHHRPQPTSPPQAILHQENSQEKRPLSMAHNEAAWNIHLHSQCLQPYDGKLMTCFDEDSL